MGRTDGRESDQYFRPMLERFPLCLTRRRLSALAATNGRSGAGRRVNPGQGLLSRKPTCRPFYGNIDTRRFRSHARVVDGTTKLSGAVFKSSASQSDVVCELADGSRTLHWILDGKQLAVPGGAFFVDRAFEGFNAGLEYLPSSSGL